MMALLSQGVSVSQGDGLSQGVMTPCSTMCSLPVQFPIYTVFGKIALDVLYSMAFSIKIWIFFLSCDPFFKEGMRSTYSFVVPT